MARKLLKPVIIHCRDSFKDTYEIIAKYSGEFPVILHSWTGGNKWTKKFIELGVYFSLSGILTYETAKDLNLSVRKILWTGFFLKRIHHIWHLVFIKAKTTHPSILLRLQNI